MMRSPTPWIARTLLWGACVAAPGLLAAQETTLRGFADATFSAAEPDDQPTAFGIGQFDLFITSRLSPTMSFLGEVVFEYVGEDFIADVERVGIEYRAKPQIGFEIGRMHNPIGYWLTEYHHGTLLEPVIERPRAFRFEDEGGLLPVHVVGLRIGGTDIGPLSLGYDVVIGNGIASTPVGDLDDRKSLTIRVFSQITSSTRFGISGYGDRIPAGTPRLADEDADDPGTLRAPVRHRILDGFFAHTGSHLELITEAAVVRNRSEGLTHSTKTWYGYAGYRTGDWVPYVLADLVDVADDDPYFEFDDRDTFAAGLRWDLAGSAALKGEFQLHREITRDYLRVLFQASVGF